MMDFAALRRQIERLDRILEPIADRPVAFGPDLSKRLTELPKPLDEAGIGSEAENALEGAIDLYLQAGPEQRQEIRDLFRRNRAFAWAASLPFRPDSAAHVRRHLAHFSIIDQGRDPRDAILWLNDLRKSPWYGALCREIADLSSDEDRYGFGSTRAMLISI